MVIDQDYAYKDYPSIIKSAGKNGYAGGAQPAPSPTPAPSKSINELANEVIQGK